MEHPTREKLIESWSVENLVVEYNIVMDQNV
jgi:hypothetical protein